MDLFDLLEKEPDDVLDEFDEAYKQEDNYISQDTSYYKEESVCDNCNHNFGFLFVRLYFNFHDVSEHLIYQFFV